MCPGKCFELFSNVKALLPECVIKAGIWFYIAIDIVLTRYLNNFTRISNWSREKCAKYEQELIIILKIIGIFIFSLDLGTDSFIGIKFLTSGKFYEGLIIIIFTILPMLFISLRLIIYASLGGKNSRSIKCLPSLSAVVCSPILPLGWLVFDVVARLSGRRNPNNGNGNNNAITEATRVTADKAAKLIKIIVAVGESYPQTIIQLFIIFGSLAVGDKVFFYQWIGVAVSLISLSISVSTGYFHTEAATSSKIVFLLFGLFAVGSRQVVCCVYSMHYPVLWLVPFCAQMVASIIVWSISSKCQGQWTGLLIFALTEAYNNFTLSGLLTSSLNLMFSIIGFFLLDVRADVRPDVRPVFNTLLIIALVLATVSWVCNILFAVVPQCEDIRKDWMKRPDAETTEPDVEGALSGDEIIHLGALRTSTDVIEIQPDTVEIVTVAIETQPTSQKPYDKEMLCDAKGTVQYVDETNTFAYANEIHPDNEVEELDARKMYISHREPASEIESTL